MKKNVWFAILLLIWIGYLSSFTCQDSFPLSDFDPGSSDAPQRAYMYANRGWQLDASNFFNWENTWQMASKLENIYDDANRLSQVIISSISEGYLVPYSFMDYYYDENNLIAEVHYRIFQQGQWVKTYKYYYSHNQSGQIQHINVYQYNGMQWTLMSNMQYSYTDGRLASVVVTVNGFTASIYTYTYDGHGRLSILFYRYIQGDWEFVFDSRSLYSYNPDDSIAEIISEDFEDNWVAHGKSIYFYNAAAQLSEVLSQISSTPNAPWQNSYRHLYTYDANNNRIDDIYQLWQDNAWQNRQRTENTYSYVNLSDYYVELSELAVNAYPNPFAHKLTIETKATGGKLTIHNLRGQIVSTATLTGGKPISWDATGLPAGIYLIRVSDPQSSKTIKVLKY
ncbi:MAG: T9SS type A sorting domain-containing protein [Candidatus Cloacimonadaceae bacterium]|nr:T9SS type A sorting domain-containing protein [Candidatus Cloacimonadaceae bacterium]